MEEGVEATYKNGEDETRRKKKGETFKAVRVKFLSSSGRWWWPGELSRKLDGFFFCSVGN